MSIARQPASPSLPSVPLYLLLTLLLTDSVLLFAFVSSYKIWAHVIVNKNPQFLTTFRGKKKHGGSEGRVVPVGIMDTQGACL